jgi:hypothetical protein
MRGRLFWRDLGLGLPYSGPTVRVAHRGCGAPPYDRPSTAYVTPFCAAPLARPQNCTRSHTHNSHTETYVTQFSETPIQLLQGDSHALP